MYLLYKQTWSRLKPYCRWLVLGGTLFFLAAALRKHWREVAAIHITASGWATLVIALGVTLLAHTWSGWVWTWILQELRQPVNNAKFIQVYLQTNLAKYLPGNIWHYYGRISAAVAAGVSPSAATLSVLLEPLLMMAAALVVFLLGTQSLASNSVASLRVLPMVGLVTVLLAVHPRFLNLAIRSLAKLKAKAVGGTHLQVQRYPLLPLIGELGFIALRGTGFILTLLAFQPLELPEIPFLFGAFSCSWLLGLVLPGAPGGLGIFEATAIALLGRSFAPGILLSAIASYRLVSVLAESAAAGLAWLDERL